MPSSSGARALAQLALSSSLTLWAACEGNVPMPAGPDLVAEGPGGASGGGASSGDGSGAQIMSLSASGSRRLTRAEYAASVRTLLGDAAPVDATLLPIDASSPFDNVAEDQVASLSLVEALESQAETLSVWAMATEERRRALVGCTPQGPDDEACFRAFVQDFGRRAFRHPLSAAEVEDFLSFATISVEDADFYAGIRYALTTFLSHPRFVYRVEGAAAQAGEYLLDDYELATRVAYFLTGTCPDETLLDAAEAGLVNDAARLRSEVERLLKMPRTKLQLQRFHAMWLGYDRFAMDGIYGAMRRESDALVERVSFEDRDFFELFTSRETWLEPELSAHYDATSPALTEPAWVTPSDSRRAGILAHATVLAASSNTNDTSPTRRGKFIRERLLCSPVPRPPPGVDSDKPPEGASPDACKAERYEAHRTQSTCAGCHRLMDPIGFGLEQFDRLGRARSHDDGRPECPLDGRGSLDEDTDFAGPAELGQALIDSEQLEACVTQQVLSYALGRTLSVSDTRDADAIRVLGQQFRDQNRRLRSLLTNVVLSHAFRSRWDR